MSLKQTDHSQERVEQEHRDNLRLDRHRLLVLEPLRVLSGLSRRHAARQIGVTRGALRSWEDQRSVPSPSELDAVIDLYRTGLEDLLGPRQPLESPDEPGVLVVDDHRIDTNALRFTIPDTAECNERILSSYLDAVRRARGYREDERPALRSNDLIDLARVLDISDHHLDRLLADQLDLSTSTAQRTARALMVAGLMNTMILRGPTAGWLDGAGSTQTTIWTATEPHRSLFATLSASSPRTAVRVPMFTTIGRPLPTVGGPTDDLRMDPGTGMPIIAPMNDIPMDNIDMTDHPIREPFSITERTGPDRVEPSITRPRHRSDGLSELPSGNI